MPFFKSAPATAPILAANHMGGNGHPPHLKATLMSEQTPSMRQATPHLIDPPWERDGRKSVRVGRLCLSTKPPPGQEAGAGHEAVQLAHVTLRKKTPHVALETSGRNLSGEKCQKTR